MSRKNIDLRAIANIENGDLLDIACDLHGGSTVLEDIGKILSMIIHNELPMTQVIALSRVMQSQVNTWDNLLGLSQERLEKVIGCKVWSEDED